MDEPRDGIKRATIGHIVCAKRDFGPRKFRFEFFYLRCPTETSFPLPSGSVPLIRRTPSLQLASRYTSINFRISSTSCGRQLVSGGRTGPAGIPKISMAVFMTATS